jgi:hypothetical protein
MVGCVAGNITLPDVSKECSVFITKVGRSQKKEGCLLQ